MSLTTGIFHQQDLSRLKLSHLTQRALDLHTAIEQDNVLPLRRVMEVLVIVG